MRMAQQPHTMKATRILLVLLAFNLPAADLTPEGAKAGAQVVLVRVGYETKPRLKDRYDLSPVLDALTQNGFSVSLDRHILQQEVSLLEAEPQLSDREAQVLDYLRGVLSQNSLRPTLARQPQLTPDTLDWWGYHPWNWVFFGSISNRFSLALADVAPGQQILDFTVRFVDTPF